VRLPGQDAGDGPAAGGDVARGQVDLPDQQDEDLGHAEQDVERRLGEQVGEILRGDEL
jgi:hypothetical protein